MNISQKVKIELSYDLVNTSTSGNVSKGKKKRKPTNLKRYLHPHIHSSIIYHIQQMETALSVHGWMNG